jgi:hypothetical protein
VLHQEDGFSDGLMDGVTVGTAAGVGLVTVLGIISNFELSEKIPICSFYSSIV